MKKINLILILLFSGVASIAEAVVEPGYYQMRIGKRGLIEVFIHSTTVKDVPVSYGMIFWRGDKRRTFYNTKAALFGIENLTDGSQVWTRITEKDSGVIATNPNSSSPTFSVTMYTDSNDSKAGYKTLVLTQTEEGAKLGCNFEIVATKFDGDTWNGLPEEFENYSTYGRQKVAIKSNRLNGSFIKYVDINQGIRKSGAFTVSKVIPQVGGLKELSPDMEAADGRSVDRHYTSLATITQNRRFSTLHLIQFPLPKHCFGLMTSLPEVSK